MSSTCLPSSNQVSEPEVESTTQSRPASSTTACPGPGCAASDSSVPSRERERVGQRGGPPLGVQDVDGPASFEHLEASDGGGESGRLAHLERGAVDARGGPEGAVDDVRRRPALRDGEVVAGERVGRGHGHHDLL